MHKIFASFTPNADDDFTRYFISDLKNSRRVVAEEEEILRNNLGIDIEF
jgi:hypothetical protein